MLPVEENNPWRFLTNPGCVGSDVDLGSLADCVLECFAILLSWRQAPQIGDEIRVQQPGPYFATIDIAVDAVEMGHTFADKIIDLCDDIHHNQRPFEHLLIDVLEQARRAHHRTADVNQLLTRTKFELKELTTAMSQPGQACRPGIWNISSDELVLNRRLGYGVEGSDFVDTLAQSHSASTTLDKIIDHLDNFTNWWRRMEQALVSLQMAIHTRESEATSEIGKPSVRKRWVGVRNNHERRIKEIKDYLPIPMVQNGIRLERNNQDEVYEDLVDIIIKAALKDDPSGNEAIRQARKLRHRMAVLGPVQSLVKSSEYCKDLLDLKGFCDLPISESTLGEAVQKGRHGILVLLGSVVDSESQRGMVLALRGDDAKRFIDVIDIALDHPVVLDETLHQQALYLLVKLCKASQQLPSSIEIRGVKLYNQQPLFGGGFSDIYHASYRGSDIAVKRLRVFDHDQEREMIHQAIYREALSWRRLRHPFVLPFLGIDSNIFSPFLCMISPWMANGTIAKHPGLETGRINMTQTLLEIAQGVEYIHGENTVHGDLRGANILLDDEFHVRIADFGLTRIADATSTASTTNRQGCLRWMAPELLSPNTFGLKFERTFATDVYAFACVCIEVYTGRAPFWNDRSDGDVLLSVLDGRRPPRPTQESESRPMSDEMWHLVERCWQHDLLQRPTISEVVNILKGATS